MEHPHSFSTVYGVLLSLGGGAAGAQGASVAGVEQVQRATRQHEAGRAHHEG